MTIRVGRGPRLTTTTPGRRWLLYVAIAAAVILLAAAGSIAADPLVTTLRGHGQPPANKAAAVKLDSPRSIAQRLADLGAPCTQLSARSNPLWAAARAGCYVNGNEIVISTYASHEAAEAAWDFQSRLLAGIRSLDMAIGDIWTIAGDDAVYIEHAADLLGGTYRHQDGRRGGWIPS